VYPLMLNVNVGLNIFELDAIAVRGSNGVNNAELSIKSTENWVCAITLLDAVRPFKSNMALKALIEASVVILGLAIW